MRDLFRRQQGGDLDHHLECGLQCCSLTRAPLKTHPPTNCNDLQLQLSSRDVPARLTVFQRLSRGGLADPSRGWHVPPPWPGSASSCATLRKDSIARRATS